MLGLQAAMAAAAVIPWIAAVPPAPTVPAVAPPCVAASLQAELELEGAAGSFAGSVVIDNEGPQSCSLLAQPRVELAGASNDAGVRVTTLRPEPRQPGLRYPSLRSLPRGAAAAVPIAWSNWCGARDPSELVVRIAGGTFHLALLGSPPATPPARRAGSQSARSGRAHPLHDRRARCRSRLRSWSSCRRAFPASPGAAGRR